MFFGAAKAHYVWLHAKSEQTKLRYPLSQPFSMTGQLLDQKWKAWGGVIRYESSKCFIAALAGEVQFRVLTMVSYRSYYRKQGLSHCA